MSEGPRVPQPFPGDSGWSRGPAVSSKSPGRLGPVSDILQGRPAVPGDLGPGRTERGVEQASRATRANVREPTGSNSCPGRLGPIPEASRCRPDVPGDWRFGPKARGVDQLSWLTWVRLRGPAGSKGCPGGSGPFLKAHGVDQFSLGFALWSDCPQGGPALLGDSHSCPRFHEVAPMFWQLGSGCEGLQGRPGVPGDSGPCPGPCGVIQMSLASPAQLRGPAVSTRCPRPLALAS